MSQANRDVTVVVPFRDVQNFFAEFLQSVAAQTAFARAHVILVDNGSSDQSVAIAGEFAGRHPNVDLVSQPLGRAGDARNMGMDMAVTPYIVFWDADDIVPERSLEVLRNTIVKTRATVVVGREKHFPKPVKAPWHKYFGKSVKTVGSVVDVPDLIHSASCWNKIFDLDLLRSQGIRFGTGTAFEDAYVSLPALLLSERIALVDAPVYEYRRRGDGTSVMDTIWDLPQNYADQLVMLEYLAGMRQGLTPYEQEALERFLIRSMQGFLLRAPQVFGESDCRQLFERCRTLYWGITSEQFARSTHDTRHRLPYLALHFGDFDLFYRPASVLGSVFGREGDLHVDYPGTSWGLPLTKVTSVPARIEGVSAGEGGTAVVHGRFSVNGLPDEVLAKLELQVWFERSGKTLPAVNHGQAHDGPGQTGAVFSVAVDPREFPAGSFPVRLVLCTRGRDVSRPCAVSPSLVQQQPVNGFHGLARITAEGGNAQLVIESAQH
ncbi:MULTISPECIES: glycosyltransferase family 2 protein [Streptomyces]|jgi:glycosyltransferase involved in cell wall biosynthesis|uniref:glycosyltransferase family 2 protein n=1 Tax=Streptomyces TaxID=1883 RepID=UPI001EFB84F0|nr:glycosyltransferase family 2 protein [Streptomyces sp. CL12-4]MCG8965019.1 glycosyltransferase family 2 protein [Streptomyces sp. CL12-4]